MSRKFRWVAEHKVSDTETVRNFVRLTGRPNVKVLDDGTMETEGPKTITLTYFDIGGDEPEIKKLWYYVAEVYQAWDKEKNQLILDCVRKIDIDLTLIVPGSSMNVPMLGLQPSKGWEELERWHLTGCWPKAIDFGNLDYSNEVMDIEITWMYDACTYESIAPSFKKGDENGK